jgi:parvulin-like peptidyl-prolyl isomerase
MAVGIASLVIGLASAAASYMQGEAQAASQKKYAEAQAEAHQEAARLNNRAAIQEYNEQSAAERISQMQEQEAASSEIQRQQAEGLKAQGTMLASSNASGMALEMMQQDFARQELWNKERIRQNYLNTAVKADASLSSLKMKTENRIASNSQPYTYMDDSASQHTWNTVGLALNIGKAGINAYDKYSTAQGKVGTEPTKGGSGSVWV